MKLLKLAFTVFCLLLVAVMAQGQQHPNIIFILADDMGYGDVSALNKQSKISTPAIDKLIAEGMSFSDAHTASSVCTPSRYAILTGRYPWRSTLKAGVLGLYAPPLIDTASTTVAQMLKKNGYQTACIGKWHLGWDWPLQNGSYFGDSLYQGHNNEPVRIELAKQIDFRATIDNGPLTRGFDYYFGTDVPNYPPYTFIENNRVVAIPDTEKPIEMYGHDGSMLSGWTLENILPTLATKASAYISQKAKDRKPFFLYLPLTSPHAPIAPTNKFKNSSKAGLYGDFVQETDWVVSEVMKAVKAGGIEKNTIIIFTSDNGSPETDGENMYGKLHSIDRFDHDPSDGYRGIKADIWEGGHHVPFVVKWPGHIKSNKSSNTSICLADFFATCADIVGNNINDNTAVDSYSLLPMLQGKQTTYTRPYLVHASSGGYFAIRQGKWKLIMSAGSGGWSTPTPGKEEEGLPAVQLYDMESDKYETNNLYAEYPEIVQQLQAQLKTCIESGRSTQGVKQENEGNFIPATIKWMK